MAQTPKQKAQTVELDTVEPISSTSKQRQTIGLHQPVASGQPLKKDCSRQAASEQQRFERFSSHRISKSSIKQQLAASEHQHNFQVIASRHFQPSKNFFDKSRSELKSLLESIKENYQEEIRTLYNDELHPDLFVQVGEQVRPLHKCIIASRAFKIYSALKNFKLSSADILEDIVVSKIQADKNEKGNEEEEVDLSSRNEKVDDPVDKELLEAIRLKEEQQREALEIFNCVLPEDLISLELLCNFTRRAYLDQDLSEEEPTIHQRFVDWIKINRPELIRDRAAHRHSPDHRESFRTVLPNFDELSIGDAASKSNEIVMSTSRGPSSTTGGGTTIDTDSNADEADETSLATSTRDESLNNSLLTRTETFELISSKRHPSSSEVGTPNKTASESTDDDSRRRSETNADANESESSEVYAPTTRTGLKPKQFTTPVGIRASTKTNRTSSIQKATPSRDPTSKATGKTGAGESVLRSGSISKPPVGSSPSVAAKRAIGKAPSSSDASPSTAKSPSTTMTSKSKPANPTTPSSNVAGKATATKFIARAQPISLERSQSPGLGHGLKGSTPGATKNFIAANKRIVSQMDHTKKLVSQGTAQGDNPTVSGSGELDLETSEANLLAFESLTTDNIAAHIDQFTLVSYSKLAEALSRMFVGEILTDTILLARDEKRVSAHKCILAARSAYLNDFIQQKCLPSTSGASAESSGASKLLKVDLSEFSHAAVYFSILHIYSGAVKVPEDLELDELAKLSHLLHVPTLRQVCVQNLRMNYCHYFHKPCNICCLGVLKTLPLAWRYDYTELYGKCLQWIGANFASIFCLEEFSKLKPHDLIEECYNATLSQLTPDNVIQKTIECQKLLKNLPRVKWTEAIICLVGRQLEDFCHYVAENYERILQTESFLNLGKSCWECEVLEENLLAAMNHLKPDSGCKTLIQLDKLECSIETYCDEPRTVSESFVSLISKMRKYCERYLLKEATSVVHCSSWRQMTPSLQKRIKDQALLATDFDEPTKQLASKPKLPSMTRHQRSSPSPQQLLAGGGGGSASGSEGARSPSSRSTPDSRLKSPSTTYLPPPKNKPAAARHVKVLK